MDERLFDAAALARRLRAALGGGPEAQRSLRALSEATGVSIACLSRVLRAHPYTSHENVLRLVRWLDLVECEQGRAA